MEHLLIIRFSALGDVAMTVPVVYSLARQYPELRITVLSKDFMQPLFSRLPSNVHFIGVNLKKEYAGLKGLNRLFRRICEEQITAVADLHDVLRTQYLRFRFRMKGIPTAHIRKERNGRKQLTRRKNKKLVPQKTSFRKYTDVLAASGYPVETDFRSLFGDGRGDLSLLPFTEKKDDAIWIGIAPFAAHKGKIYPLEQMERIIARLSEYPAIHIFLFGADGSEQQLLHDWHQRYPHTTAVPDKRLTLDKELILISHLDVMLSMDSANMHLASLVATPVVSIWGATHPYAGFAGWNQPAENQLQAELPCRPCSIFGNRPCFRKDYACLHRIKTEEILDKLNHIAHFRPAP
ncbi:MAG: glycosyltransferase family 9 protein [Paraprevotella sp.]|nr:glycosyltransferase family 9 protein [Paraprevotella sp.]